MNDRAAITDTSATPRAAQRIDAAVLVVAALVAAVPLVTGNLTGLGVGTTALLYDSQALPRFVLAAVLVAAAWSVWFFGGSDEGARLRLALPGALLGGLAAWAGVSAALSPHRALAVLGQSERMEGAATLLLYALLYGIGLQVPRTSKHARTIAAWFVVGVGLSALYGLLQFIGADTASYVVEGLAFDTRRAFATMGNPNFLAGALVLALPVATTLALAAQKRVAGAGYTAIAAAIAAALVATATRGAWLAALVEAAVLGNAMMRLRGREAIRHPKIVVTAIAVALTVVVAVSLLSPGEVNVWRRLADAASLGGSVSERASAAQTAVAAVAARPILGYGPDTFLPAFRANRSDGYVERFGSTATINNAHSWPLQYAATLGVPGMLLLVGMLVAAFWGSRSSLADAGSGSDALVTAGVWTGCLGFAVHMLFNVAALGATVPFFVLLGALAAPSARTVRLTRFAARIGLGVSVVALLAAAVGGVQLLRADSTYLASRLAFRGMGAGDAAQLALTASALNPLSVKYRRGVLDARIAAFDDALADEAPVAELESSYGDAITAARYASALDARDYPTLAWTAALQASAADRLGDTELKREAAATAEMASALDRQHSDVTALADGQLTAGAIATAASVPPLP